MAERIIVNTPDGKLVLFLVAGTGDPGERVCEECGDVKGPFLYIAEEQGGQAGGEICLACISAWWVNVQKK